MGHRRPQAVEGHRRALADVGAAAWLGASAASCVVNTGWASIEECRARFRELEHEAKRLGELAQRAADRIIQLEAALSRRDAELAEASRLLEQTRQERDAANVTARRLFEEVERTQSDARRSAPHDGDSDAGTTASRAEP